VCTRARLHGNRSAMPGRRTMRDDYRSLSLSLPLLSRTVALLRARAARFDPRRASASRSTNLV